MVSYFDSHCHYSPKSADFISNLRTKKIFGALCNAVSEEDWINIINLSQISDFFSGAIGIHPWSISNLKPGWQNRLEFLLQQNQNLLVGEIGLDKYKADLEKQIEAFIIQLKLAHKLNRSVSIHCVGAWDKVLQILKNLKDDLPPAFLFHSYSGNLQIMRQLVPDYNCFFSYSGRSFKNINEKFIDIIRETPIDKLLIETDSENIEDILKTADLISSIRPESKEVLLESIYKNSKAILKNG